MHALTYQRLCYKIKEKGVNDMQLNVVETRAEDKSFLLSGRMKELVLSYVPDDKLLNDLVGFFTVFSDYTRLKMISALSISEMCVSDISGLLGINQTILDMQYDQVHQIDYQSLFLLNLGIFRFYVALEKQ